MSASLEEGLLVLLSDIAQVYPLDVYVYMVRIEIGLQAQYLFNVLLDVPVDFRNVDPEEHVYENVHVKIAEDVRDENSVVYRRKLLYPGYSFGSEDSFAYELFRVGETVLVFGIVTCHTQIPAVFRRSIL